MKSIRILFLFIFLFSMLSVQAEEILNQTDDQSEVGTPNRVNTKGWRIIKVIAPNGIQGNINIINSSGQKVKVEIEDAGNGVYYIHLKKYLSPDMFYKQPDQNQKPPANLLVSV